MSMASASISLPRLDAGRTALTAARPSSPLSGRIRSWPASSSWPSLGISAPAVIASADFRPGGRNGTINTARPCGAIRMAKETCWAKSAGLFNHDGRSPRSSINHVTVHDGFTLVDLVSYSQKHNEANGEDNRDGSDDNQSINCGVEGPSDDPEIVNLRRQLRRNHLATLFLGQGVPLLLAGDEVGNSQNGNNNAYCQDNEIGWVKWKALGSDGDDMADLVAQLTALRRRFPQLRPRHWVEGRREDGSFGVIWLTPQG